MSDTYSGVTGPLAAWMAVRDRNQQLGDKHNASMIQQGAGLQGILAGQMKIQEQQQLQGILSSQMPDDQKLAALARGAGGSAGVDLAHKWATVQGQMQQIALNKQFGNIGTATPEQLDAIGQRLAIGGHPGAATVMNIADKRRAIDANRQALEGMRSSGGQAPSLAGTAPPDELGGGPVSPGTAGIPGKSGVADFLINSEFPIVANSAKTLQARIDSGTPGLTPQMVDSQMKMLTQMHQTAAEKRASDERKVGNAIDFKVMWPPGAGGSHAQQQGVLDPVKDKDELRDLAIQSMYDPNSLAGFRRDTKTMGNIQRERLKLMKESGITSEDVVSGRAGFKADTYSLNKITPQYDSITAFENTAIRNGKMLVDLANKVDTTGVPVVERWIRAGRQSVAGDPEVAKFNAQINLYRAEVARILTQPNLSGVLTDSARKEAEDFLPSKASKEQIAGVVGLLERDFENRKITLEEQISSIRARMRGRVSPGGGGINSEAPPAVAPAPAGSSDLRKKYGL